MEILLNRAYISTWDNIQYPIFKLTDDAYLCITYSSNHSVYSLNTYTKEEFVEQGFVEDEDSDEIFERLTEKDLALW